MASPTQDPIWNDGSSSVPQAIRFGGNPVLPVLFHLVRGGDHSFLPLTVPPKEDPTGQRHQAVLFLEKKAVALLRKREVERLDL